MQLGKVKGSKRQEHQDNISNSIYKMESFSLHTMHSQNNMNMLPNHS